VSLRVRRWLLTIAAAVAGGGLIYVIVAAVTTNPVGASLGFPFTYSTPGPPCASPNPFNGCGFSFNIYPAIADFLVWFGVLLAAITLVQSLRAYHRARSRAKGTARS
jgi:hypothetical protein